jgi:hypothetical protein
MRSTDFPFAVMPQRLQRGGRPDYSAPSAALAAVRADDDQQFGGISARDTSVRDQIKDKLAVIVGRRNADKLMGVAEIAGADAPLMLDEARLAYREGRPGEAAATAALAVLPIPGAAKKGIKAAAKGAKVAAPAAKAAGDVLRVRPAAIAKPEPRIEPRKKEQARVQNLEVTLRPRRIEAPKELSVFDLEGKPFITSMSDLSAAGDDIVAIDDVPLHEPVSRMGGQDYMFDAPESVWAADLRNAGMHLDMARALKRETGQDPLFFPWAMGPTAIDFSHMPRELMLRYAAEALPASQKKTLAKDIQGILPEFKSLDDTSSAEVFREATGADRAALNRLLDKYREVGGLGMGAARLAMTDLPQVGQRLTTLRNVGTIESGRSLAPSMHPSYRTSIPGGGVGRLREEVGALELLPALMEEAGLSDPFGFPVGVVPGVKSPLRALQMSPKGGVITDKMLRAIEKRLSEKPD